MLKRLIALLALITGLTALAAPVHAWGDTSNAGSVEASRTIGSDYHADCSDAERAESTNKTRLKERKAFAPKKKVVVKVPSVFLGSDRSFE